MERLKEGMLSLTRGWDRTQIERLVARGHLRGDRPVRVSGGARPDGPASERGPPHLHRVVLARGGRAPARPALRRERRDRDARRGRTTTAATRASSSSTRTASRRPRRSAASPSAPGHRPRRVLRVQRLDHRPPDARRRSATRWRSTRQGAPREAPRSAAGRSATSAGRCGCAPGSRQAVPPPAALDRGRGRRASPWRRCSCGSSFAVAGRSPRRA